MSGNPSGFYTRIPFYLFGREQSGKMTTSSDSRREREACSCSWQDQPAQATAEGSSPAAQGERQVVSNGLVNKCMMTARASCSKGKECGSGRSLTLGVEGKAS